MKKYTLFLTVCCLCCLVGCSTGGKQNTAKTSGAQKQILQQDVLQSLKQVRSSQAYKLQPGDLVEIQVFREDNMDRTLRISGNGTITFPLVGVVPVAGLSLEEAEQRLMLHLSDYLRNPQVSILVKEYGNKTVYVLGQVHKPAAIQMPPEKPLTVLEAITSVGGFTDIANTSKVRVLRMENGKQTTLDVDVSQITKQGNKSLDIALMPGDVVFVPQSMF
ncbi:MAG: polysaccharide export protein [Elusimicrobiaceae bacterium]|nr:polysaccharide export protein [Elusimicrobiaceae bacterium]